MYRAESGEEGEEVFLSDGRVDSANEKLVFNISFYNVQANKSKNIFFQKNVLLNTIFSRIFRFSKIFKMFVVLEEKSVMLFL